MPVTWSDEKLILLYCSGRGSNSRPSARRSFKHGQGVLRSNHSATAAVIFALMDMHISLFSMQFVYLYATTIFRFFVIRVRIGVDIYEFYTFMLIC